MNQIKIYRVEYNEGEVVKTIFCKWGHPSIYTSIFNILPYQIGMGIDNNSFFCEQMKWWQHFKPLVKISTIVKTYSFTHEGDFRLNENYLHIFLASHFMTFSHFYLFTSVADLIYALL